MSVGGRMCCLWASVVAAKNVAAMAGKLYKKEQVAGVMKQYGTIPAGM
jgi:hypothetical protein